MAKGKRRLKAEDLYKIRVISDPEISPGGEHIVFTLSRIDKKTEKKYANLWIVPTSGSRAVQFTYGDQTDIKPVWSPDGKSIAFLSNRINEKQFQIFFIPFSGGEAYPVTDLHGSFYDIQWSPDSKSIVFCFRKKDRDEIMREKDEAKKKLGIIYRDISRVFFKHDGEGYLPSERKHLWIIKSKGGKPKQITESDIFDEWSPSWSPDGKKIVFLSNRSKYPDLDPEAIDLFTYILKSGTIRKIKTPSGPKEHPVFSPDNKWITYIGREGKKVWWKNERIWIVPVSVSGKAVNLTEKYDFTVSSWTINDILGMPPMSAPVWSCDSEKIFFLVSHHGNTTLKAVSCKTNLVEDVINKKGVSGFVSFDGKREKVAFLFSEIKNPGEIWVENMSTKKSRQLTSISMNYLKNIEFGQVEEVWIKGPSGKELQGWIMKPPGFDSMKKYPSILEIHGGPQVQYGNVFMFEFLFLSSQGYIIHFCNPPGSIGYGEEYTRAVWNNWGTIDYDALMKWTDFISQKRYIDKDRMGVTGGSYGGYMTNWIIGRTRNFKAAVTQRSVCNLVSFWGTSDVNWYFQTEFGDEPPWENIENYWRQSPLKSIKKARTPTLIIHSENDMRCSIEQAEQVYVALKKLGVETKMVIFSDESHGLSRSGRTDRRIERLKCIQEWFDKYLKQ